RPATFFAVAGTPSPTATQDGNDRRNRVSRCSGKNRGPALREDSAISRTRTARRWTVKVAFLFSGQGAQSVGMGKQLLETVPAARRLFDQAAEVLGYDLREICLNGPAEKLNSTVVSQPAIFVTSLAALESLRANDPAIEQQCTGTAGLSLGEYTALVFA